MQSILNVQYHYLVLLRNIEVCFYTLNLFGYFIVCQLFVSWAHRLNRFAWKLSVLEWKTQMWDIDMLLKWIYIVIYTYIWVYQRIHKQIDRYLCRWADIYVCREYVYTSMHFYIIFIQYIYLYVIFFDITYIFIVNVKSYTKFCLFSRERYVYSSLCFFISIFVFLIDYFLISCTTLLNWPVNV